MPESWPLCDKCKRPVHPRNNATLIELAAFDNPILGLLTSLGLANARHFLPTPHCEGSPSRAQYLEGQPRDNRGYPYKKKYEDAFRRGYKFVQEKADEQGL